MGFVRQNSGKLEKTIKKQVYTHYKNFPVKHCDFCNSYHSWWLEKYTLNFNAIPIKDSADDKSPVVSVPHSLAKEFP